MHPLVSFSLVSLSAGVCSTVRGVMSVFFTSGVRGLELLHPLRSDAGPAVPPLLQRLSDAVGGVRVRAAPGSPLGASPGQVGEEIH